MAANLRRYCWVPLLVCALPAAAQTSVTIMGGVDACVGSTENSGETGRTTVAGSGGMTTSWFGFRGKEEPGDGRTDLHTVAMRDRITTLPSAMSHGAGLRHSF